MLAALRHIGADLSLPALHHAITATLAELVPATSVAIFALEGAAFRCASCWSEGASTAPERRLVPSTWEGLEALASGRALWIADTGAERTWPPFAAVRPGGSAVRPGGSAVRSWLGVPILDGDRLLAFVDLAFAKPRPSIDEERQDLERLAPHIASSLRHALLLEERSRQARHADLRADLQAQIAEGSPTAIVQRLVQAFGEALEVSWCLAIDHAFSTRRAAAIAQDGVLSSDRRVDAIVLAVARTVATQGRPLAVADCETDTNETIAAGREALLTQNIRALLAVPMMYEGTVAGVLALLQDGMPRTWQPAEVVLAQAMGADAAAALSRARREAERDRAASEVSAERDRLRAAIDAVPISVVITDTTEEPIFWNRATSVLAGTMPQHGRTGVATVPTFEVLREDGSTYPADQSPLSRAYREAHPVSDDRLLVRRRDGRVLPAAISALPLHDSRGTVDGAITLIQDLTAQRALEQLGRRAVVQAQLVHALTGSIIAGTPLQDLLSANAAAIGSALPADLLVVARPGLDGEPGVIATLGVRGDAAHTPAALARLAVSTGDAVVVPSLGDEETLDQAQGLIERGFRSALAVPIRRQDGVAAVLQLFSRRPGAYGDGEVEIARDLSDQLALALSAQASVQDARDDSIKEERERLAREIHDTLAQTITGVVMQLDSVVTATPAEAPHRARLEQARTMARDALNETRRAVWNMRPLNVNMQMPRNLLLEEAALLERRMNLKPQVVTSGEERQVAPEIGAALQRLLRVALENTWTHSQAAQVRILLDYGIQSLTVLIEDDGRGFDPDTVDLFGEGRVGLSGVADRIRTIGGSLRIESATGHGTRVQAELPYAPAPPVQRPAPAEVPPPPRGAIDPGERIRVLLIDDHAMVREGLERMMHGQADIQVVGAAATGAEGLRRIADLQPDVVLCDLQLPDMSGVDVISRVRTHFPDVRCLVVTTFDDDDSIHQSFKAGALGYVLKDVSAADLSNAVRAASRGESLLQPVVARSLVEGFGELARQGGVIEALTEREVEVLKALAGGARNKEIAFSLGLSESTIKTHLASIFGKLGVTTRTEAVAKGRDLGLIAL